MKNQLKSIARTCHGKIDNITRLPDGSGFATMSMPLPKNHWLTQDGDNKPPAPWKVGTKQTLTIGPDNRVSLIILISVAARYAIRASTNNGKVIDFDPDAMVQNFIVGMLGYNTPDGLSYADDVLKEKSTIPAKARLCENLKLCKYWKKYKKEKELKCALSYRKKCWDGMIVNLDHTCPRPYLVSNKENCEYFTKKKLNGQQD